MQGQGGLLVNCVLSEVEVKPEVWLPTDCGSIHASGMGVVYSSLVFAKVMRCAWVGGLCFGKLHGALRKCRARPKR